MHENAKIAVKRKVHGIIQNTIVQRSDWSFDISQDHLMPLCKEVVKHKADWLDTTDVANILYFKLHAAIDEARDKGPIREGVLKDVLGIDAVSSLKTNICDYIFSIPREVSVFIPFGVAPDDFPAEIVLSDSICLRSYGGEARAPNESEILFAISRHGKVDRKVYLKVVLSCCPSYSYASKFARKALLISNCFLQSAISNDVITLREEGRSGLIGSPHYSAEKAELVVEDRNIGSLPFTAVKLLFSQSRLVSKLDFRISNAEILKHIETSGWENLIVQCMKNTVSLIQNDSAGAERIKSAAYWSMNSLSADDSTLTFIQVCIGLESLFGSDESEVGIVATLADRYAFVVARTIDERAVIRSKFRALYKVRSALVHGVSQELSTDQWELLRWGRILLDLGIKSECRML